jgi:glycosyltransferase involved in cell wall biosynthesis
MGGIDGEADAMETSGPSTCAPLVSVIIPTYNYGRYLGKALASCKSQTYKRLEIIVVDDGSTDDTRGVVERFGPDPVYIFQENKGVSRARNTGLEVARGELLTFLDADDYLLPDSIAARAEILRSRPDIGIVFSDTYSCDAQGNLSYKEKGKGDRVSERFYEDLLLRHLRFQTSAAMMRSSLAKRFSFPPELSNGEDIVYFSKVFFAAKGYFLARPTVVNLHHEDSLRHNVDEVLRQDMAFVGAVLDDPFYGGALDYMRNELTSKRRLELFRRLYLAHEGARAREHYMKAIAIRPASLFKLSYLSKALRSFFMTRR